MMAGVFGWRQNEAERKTRKFVVGFLRKNRMYVGIQWEGDCSAPKFKKLECVEWTMLAWSVLCMMVGTTKKS